MRENEAGQICRQLRQEFRAFITSFVARQKAEGWGKSVVGRLAADLQKEFPGESGFSPGNIWRMRAFYLAWTVEARDIASLVSQGHWEELQHAAGELPHTVLAQLARKLDGSNLPQPAAEPEQIRAEAGYRVAHAKPMQWIGAF